MSLAAGERSERLAPNRLPKDLAEDHVSALEVSPMDSGNPGSIMYLEVGYREIM